MPWWDELSLLLKALPEFLQGQRDLVAKLDVIVGKLDLMIGLLAQQQPPPVSTVDTPTGCTAFSHVGSIASGKSGVVATITPPGATPATTADTARCAG